MPIPQISLESLQENIYGLMGEPGTVFPLDDLRRIMLETMKPLQDEQPALARHYKNLYGSGAVSGIAERTILALILHSIAIYRAAEQAVTTQSTSELESWYHEFGKKG